MDFGAVGKGGDQGNGAADTGAGLGRNQAEAHQGGFAGDGDEPGEKFTKRLAKKQEESGDQKQQVESG